MSRAFALPLVLLAGLAFGLPTSVHAAKQKPWTFAIASAADFEAQAAEVRKEMEPEGRFGTISADERTAVEADLDRISSLLGQKGTPARLNDPQQVEMANAQERINAILTGNDGDRLICKFEPRTGTKFKEKVCLTQREWTRTREDATKAWRDSLMAGSALQDTGRLPDGAHDPGRNRPTR
jgi:hypothetical protein